MIGLLNNFTRKSSGFSGLAMSTSLSMTSKRSKTPFSSAYVPNSGEILRNGLRSASIFVLRLVAMDTAVHVCTQT